MLTTRRLLLLLASAILVSALAPTAALAGNGWLSGTVRDAATGNPVAGVPVSVYDNVWESWPSTGVATVMTDAEGRYDFPDMNWWGGPNGVGVTDPTRTWVMPNSGLASVMLPGVADVAVYRSGTITGRVTAPSGAPVVGERVKLEWNAPYSGWVNMHSTETTTDGRYTFRLPPGEYRVSFSDPTGAYYDQYYPTNAAPATLKVSSATTTTAGVKLTGPGTLVGTARDSVSGEPIAGMNVEVWRASGTGWGWVARTTTDDAGRYRLAQLPPGSYRVACGQSDGPRQWRYWPSASSLSRGTSIPVAAVATSTADFKLGYSLRISGYNRGPASTLSLYRYDPKVDDWLFVASRNPGPDANYSFWSLPPARYRLHVAPQTNTDWYVSYWWRDAPYYFAAEDVVMTDSHRLMDIHHLRKGAVSGTVTREDGAPLSGALVQLFRWDPNGSRWYYTGKWVRTAGDGTYSALVPEAEFYIVRASKPGYRASWYGGTTEASEAAGVGVGGGPGIGHSGIDVALAPGEAAAELTMESTTGVVPYRRATVRGRLMEGGAPWPGEWVLIQQSTDGRRFTDAFAVKTSVLGEWQVDAQPTRRVWYRAVYGGIHTPDVLVTPAVRLTPRAWMSTPAAPSTAVRNRAFRVSVDLKPRHTPGTDAVLFLALRYERVEDGYDWVLRKVVPGRAGDYSSYTRCTASMALPAGKWVIAAVHEADSRNAETISRERAVLVR